MELAGRRGAKPGTFGRRVRLDRHEGALLRLALIGAWLPATEKQGASNITCESSATRNATHASESLSQSQIHVDFKTGSYSNPRVVRSTLAPLPLGRSPHVERCVTLRHAAPVMLAVQYVHNYVRPTSVGPQEEP